MLKDMILEISDKHGSFEFGDAQGDVRVAFARDVIDKHEKIQKAAPILLHLLEQMYNDIVTLMEESDGVAGLHMNGDVAYWSELDEGGRFERFSNLSRVERLISELKESR